TATTRERLERLIEWMDKPLLALAVLTMVVYLLDLNGRIDRATSIWTAMTLVIDVVFVLDLALKLWVYGGSYVRTPWFLIDLISCLPLFDALVTGVKPRATRLVRGMRILRVLRGLRILRALRSIPAFEQFIKDSPGTQTEKRLHRAMNIALVG